MSLKPNLCSYGSGDTADHPLTGADSIPAPPVHIGQSVPGQDTEPRSDLMAVASACVSVNICVNGGMWQDCKEIWLVDKTTRVYISKSIYQTPEHFTGFFNCGKLSETRFCFVFSSQGK